MKYAMDMGSPCKGCERRELGCHGKCEDYKAYREDRDRMNANRYETLENQFYNNHKGQTRRRRP